MPDFAGFASFARKVGAPHAPPPRPQPEPVAPVSPVLPEGDTPRATEKTEQDQSLRKLVAPVSLVSPQNDDGWTDEDWQAAYDERAGILEYDEGLPRAEAERLAREQVFGDRPIGNVRLTVARDGTSR